MLQGAAVAAGAAIASAADDLTAGSGNVTEGEVTPSGRSHTAGDRHSSGSKATKWRRRRYGSKRMTPVMDNARQAVMAALRTEGMPSSVTAKEVLLGVVDAWRSAGQSATAAAKLLIAGLTDRSKAVNMTLDQVVSLLFFGWLLVATCLVGLLRPSALALFSSVMVGAVVGVGLSYMYYFNKADKEEVRKVVSACVCPCMLQGRPFDMCALTAMWHSCMDGHAACMH
eukprot:349592-Chlamydomonas_euryale.AAC.1